MKLLLLFLALAAGMPQDEYLSAALKLSGAGTPEELSESEIERYDALSSNPLRINLCPRSKLLASGLFSTYQVASLCDYIASTGDILSVTELGTINGFSPELAEALSHFVSFESHAPPGMRHPSRTRQDLMLRTGAKDGLSAFAGKYHLDFGEKAEFYASARNTWSEAAFGLKSLSACYYGKRGWSLAAGDFNARLGQGLLVWSGFSMSGIPSVAAMRRSATGFSPTGSFTPGFRGLAVTATPGRWNLAAAFSALDDKALIATAGYTGNSFNLGLNAVATHDAHGLSADWQFATGSFGCFGEAAVSEKRGESAIDRGGAVIAGLQWAPAYKTKFIVSARYYPEGYFGDFAGAVRSGSKVSDEAGLSFGGLYRFINLTFDSAVHPRKLQDGKKNSRSMKMVLDASPEWKLHGWTFCPALRWADRVQLSYAGNEWLQDWRHDIRFDLGASGGPFSAKVRLNAVHLEKSGWLGFAELGYKTPGDSAAFALSAFLRAECYDTPDWDTRIYCYERDVPGSFNVPACYGQGYGVSAIVGLKKRRIAGASHSLYLRASLSDAMHGGSAVRHCEFKLQYQLRL